MMTYTTQDGVLRTQKQIEAAFAACRLLEIAYARADEETGGNSSINWADVDTARELARDAITQEEIMGLSLQASIENGAVQV